MKRVDLKKILYMDFLSGTSAQAHPRNLQQRWICHVPLSLSTLPTCAMNWKCASFSINS